MGVAMTGRLRALLSIIAMSALCPWHDAVAQSVASPPIAQVFYSGRVLATAVQGDGKVIAAGYFQFVNGLTHRYLARFNVDGSHDAAFNPAPNDVVRAIKIDSAGNIYLGGDFTSIAGQTRNRLAKLSSAGVLDPVWNPQVARSGAQSFTPYVESLALDDGGNLFVGGTFTSVSGVSRNNLAKVSAGGSGVPDATWAPNPDGAVRVLEPDGSNIFVGGSFVQIGGITRAGLARLPISGSGSTDSWNAAIGRSLGPGSVHALARDGSGNLYLGGSFDSVAGLTRRGVARVSIGSAVGDTWNPQVDGDVWTLSLDGAGNAYVGGFLFRVGNQSRSGLAKVSTSGIGTLDATWNPSAGAEVYSISRTASGHIIVGGHFHSMAGQNRAALARLEPTSAAADTAWPTLQGIGAVYASARDAAGRLIIGGSFTAVGDTTTRRFGLARFNADGGLDTQWAPDPGPWVRAIAIDEAGYVFIGSETAISIRGQIRYGGVAKISPEGAGEAEAWDPFPPQTTSDGTRYFGGQVHALALDGAGMLYVGGNLTSRTGAPQRNNLLRVTTAGSGAEDTSWNPNINGMVRALAFDGASLFVGGSFSSFAGVPRRSLAKLSTVDATPDASWVADVGGSVWSLARDGAHLYVGGGLGTIGAVTRDCLGRVSAAGTGNVDLSWAPALSSFCFISSMAPDGAGSIYVTGSFSSAGGQARRDVAKLSTAPGAAVAAWNPSLSFLFGTGGVAIPYMHHVAVVNNGNVAIGGHFHAVKGTVRPGFAIVTPDVSSDVAPAITSVSSVTFTVLSSNAFTVTKTGTPTPTLSRSGTLPNGVTFDPGTGGLSGTPASGTVGTYPLTFTATNSAGSVNQSFMLTVAKSSQSITFNNPGNRTFSKIPFAPGGVASSALTVVYTSLTPEVCGVTSTGNIAMAKAGTCTIAADQPGDGNFHAAAQVVQTFNIASTVPGAATITSLARGFDSVTIAFAPPESNGGIPITGYMATCNPGGLTQITSTSPVTITGLTPGQAYTCSIIATNANGSGPPSPPPGGSAALTSATSLEFGAHAMGMSSAPVPFAISNSGSTSISITGISLTSQYTASNACTTLAPGASCLVHVTFRPTVVAGALNTAVAVNGTLTITHSAGAALQVALSGTAEKSFVTHYYRAILNRLPDPDGKAYWQGEAARVSGLEANVNEVWFVLAGYFFNSPEYLARNKTNTQFVTDLYNTFFNREPDEGGLAYWTGQIVAGLPRDVILFQFMFSGEFRAFANNVFGNTAARPEVDMVVDFYRGIMNRLPDSSGFNYWVARLRAAQCQNSAASVYQTVEDISSFFMHGGEYAQRGRNNTQFTTDMYYSFLRRGGDLDGVRYWINELDTAARSRENVRQYFLASPEFGARVQAVIAAPCIQ